MDFPRPKVRGLQIFADRILDYRLYDFLILDFPRPKVRGLFNPKSPIQNPKLGGQFLHDLGIILHFQDDKESPLYDTIIVNPEWGTKAVYELLKEEENNPIKQQLGKFSFNDLEKILRVNFSLMANFHST